jgi:hypothetical protein
MTWFVFVPLYAVPFPFVVPLLQANAEPRADQLIFAVSQFIPLGVALVVGLLCCKLWKVAVVCFAIRSVWQYLSLFISFVGNDPAWKRAVVLALWPEGLAVKWLHRTESYMVCSIIFALVGVLLAMTCYPRGVKKYGRRVGSKNSDGL